MFRFGLLKQLLLRLRLEFEIWLLCWVKYIELDKILKTAWRIFTGGDK